MRLNVWFKCKHCHGTGQETPTSPCSVCKGTGQVLHMFVNVLKVIEFPDQLEAVDAEFKDVTEEPKADPVL